MLPRGPRRQPRAPKKHPSGTQEHPKKPQHSRFTFPNLVLEGLGLPLFPFVVFGFSEGWDIPLFPFLGLWCPYWHQCIQASKPPIFLCSLWLCLDLAAARPTRKLPNSFYPFVLLCFSLSFSVLLLIQLLRVLGLRAFEPQSCCASDRPRRVSRSANIFLV